VILAGRVEVTHRGMPGHSELIVTHGPGSFMGELAQLSGRPPLVDAYAKEAVETLVIPPRRLRDLLVEEAELGERIMRALILRRVGLLDTGGGGPVIVGSADHADVLRLEGFLTRNGHPHQRFDPKTDPCGQTLIERFHIDSRELPIVLCPNGQLLRNPSDVELAVALGMGLHAPERTLSGAAYPQRLAELLAISQQAFRLQRRHTGFHHYGSSIRTVLNVTKTV
jgi:thioredoxin reductase (NADPH)